MARKQRAKEKLVVAGSQRSSDIAERCRQFTDSLVKLYETTDPKHGAASEDNKLEAARQAISIWWYMWAELMLWSQSHLAGYKTLQYHPELRARIEQFLGTELTPDSHVLEYVGVYFSWNHVDQDDPMLKAIHGIMSDEFEMTMADPPLRHIVRELLMSRSANSSFWRFPVQEAFFALELGEVEDLVKPSEVRRQGNPVALYHLKLLALTHAHFLVGKGIKKYVALNRVAVAIGQSVETLRSWEKAYAFDDDFVMKLRASQLAGELEIELDTYSLKEVTERFAGEYYRHASDVEYAKSVLRACPEKT